MGAQCAPARRFFGPAMLVVLENSSNHPINEELLYDEQRR
jgi:hypothetical protein